MADSKNNDLKVHFITEEIETPLPTTGDLPMHQTEYKTYASAPQIPFTGLTLVIMCPILFAAHIFVARITGIPIIQYSFVTILVAFIINYTLIIRKYEIMPFLPE